MSKKKLNAVDLLKRNQFAPDRTASYETRIVAFYDVLGWTKRIEWAQDHPERIGKLKAMLEMFNHFAGAVGRGSSRLSRMTTFSDNVVISQRLTEGTSFFLLKVAAAQFAAAAGGFWVRGGVTIGPIVHTENTVFGPALNRAYELERDVAVYPRIVLDPNCVHRFAAANGVVTVEDETSFLNPFSEAVFEHLRDVGGDFFLQCFRLPHMKLYTSPTEIARENLALVGCLLQEEMLTTVNDRAWTKLAWLYDRIRKEVGAGEPSHVYRRTVLHQPVER